MKKKKNAKKKHTTKIKAVRVVGKKRNTRYVKRVKKGVYQYALKKRK